ncbi:MAG: hypothetical protein IJF87_05880 [Erysipelotrichaceae bacterium]|nr:hypothetical protein [Erysipelotrichaceae bacterium]
MYINGEETYLYSPFELKRWTTEEVEKEYYELKKRYNPDAVAPSQHADNIDTLSQIQYLFGEMAARCEKEYALEKLQVEYDEATILKTLRKSWNEKESGKAPAIDVFKAEARVACKDKWKRVFDLEEETSKFKSAYKSYGERINALKYKINASKLEIGVQ